MVEFHKYGRSSQAERIAETNEKLRSIREVAFESEELRARNGRPSRESLGYFRSLGARNRLGLYTVRAAAFNDGLFLSFRMPKDEIPMQFDFEYRTRWSPDDKQDPRDNIPVIKCCGLSDLGVAMVRSLSGYRFIESKTLYAPSFQPIIDTALEIIRKEAEPGDGSEPWQHAYTQKEILLSSHKKMQIISPDERYL